MTLFDYLDHRFKTLSLELQVDYTIPKEAELKAAYSLIQSQRSFFKYLKMPVLIFKYLLMNIGWMKIPEAIASKPIETIKPEGAVATTNIQ